MEPVRFFGFENFRNKGGSVRGSNGNGNAGGCAFQLHQAESGARLPPIFAPLFSLPLPVNDIGARVSLN